MSSTAVQASLTIQHLDAAHYSADPWGADILHGLSQHPKTLPPQYFYDERGSLLFEQICELPEYYPTRTEASILRRSAHAIAHHTGVCELIELGSGSSSKTRYLLSAYQGLGQTFQYVPIDVSGEILTHSAEQLLKDYSLLTIHGLVGTYEQALEALPEPGDSASTDLSVRPRLTIFLGSTLGNFTTAQSDRFFAQVHHSLRPGDYFLLGVDLQKDPAVLEAAYNDSQGVTAAFNLNMLQHLNSQFGSDFKPDYFNHRAIYNQTLGQIEMYLDCQQTHAVTFSKLNHRVAFQAGESIQTEISRKFTLDALKTYLASQGFQLQQHWTDPQDWFGLLLAQRV